MKQQEPVQKLAASIERAIAQYANRVVDKAHYDKSYSVKIYGVNQQFLMCEEMSSADIAADPDIQRRKAKPSTPSNYQSSKPKKLTDGVTQSEKESLISKYFIPEETEDGADKYYTVELDGEYYVLKSKADFSIGEAATVRIPNGTWSNMYLETGKGSGGADIILPQVFAQSAEPENSDDLTINPGDYWIKVDDDVNLNAQALGRYSGSQWDMMCNIPEGGGNVPQFFIQATEPSGNINVGDYWAKITNDNSKILQGLYCYEKIGNTEEWVLKYNIPSGGTYSAGNGINIQNNTISIKVGSGLKIDANGYLCLDVEPVVNIEYGIIVQNENAQGS